MSGTLAIVVFFTGLLFIILIHEAGHYLIARAYVLLRIAMTINAPVHVQRVFFERKRHQVHAPMAGGAADAFVDMNAVVEVHEIQIGRASCRERV